MGKEADHDSLTDLPTASWESPNIAELMNIVEAASFAAADLADRLNALALRIALMGDIVANHNNELEFASYHRRLYVLLNSAGEQTRRIQTLLRFPSANNKTELALPNIS
jgi:hypothetical protein